MQNVPHVAPYPPETPVNKGIMQGATCYEAMAQAAVSQDCRAWSLIFNDKTQKNKMLHNVIYLLHSRILFIHKNITFAPK